MGIALQVLIAWRPWSGIGKPSHPEKEHGRQFDNIWASLISPQTSSLLPLPLLKGQALRAGFVGEHGLSHMRREEVVDELQGGSVPRHEGREGDDAHHSQ